jgi:hypothetical protein
LERREGPSLPSSKNSQGMVGALSLLASRDCPGAYMAPIPDVPVTGWKYTCPAGDMRI